MFFKKTIIKENNMDEVFYDIKDLEFIWVI